MIEIDGHIRGPVGERGQTSQSNIDEMLEEPLLEDTLKWKSIYKYFPTFYKTFKKIFQLFKLSFIYVIDFFKLYPLYIYYKYFKYGIFPIFYKPSSAFKYIHFFKVLRILFKLRPVPRNDWIFYTHTKIYFFKIDWNSLSNIRRVAILISPSAKKRFKNDLIQEYKKFLHREDGPASISKRYCKIWAINGKFHRMDGPAVECKYMGYLQYWVNGKLHREDGPAFVYTYKTKKSQYWINGKRLNEREFTVKTFKLNVNFD